MSNDIIISEISVKDYAQSRGKTVQAVYQQMKSKHNSVALSGHIISRLVGNKHVKFLDDVAVAVLDKATNAFPLAQNTSYDLIFDFNQFEKLKLDYMKLQGRCELLQEQLQDQQQKLLAFDTQKKEIELLEGFIQDAKSEIEVQTVHNSILSKEKAEAIERALKAEKEAQTASESLTEALKEIERLNNQSFFHRLFKHK